MAHHRHHNKNGQQQQQQQQQYDEKLEAAEIHASRLLDMIKANRMGVGNTDTSCNEFEKTYIYIF